MYDYDFPGANADFVRAMELEPGYATGHQWFAEILAAQGRTDEALEQADLAFEADPRSAIVAHVKGWILMFAGRLDEAIVRFQETRALDPELQAPLFNLGLVYLMQGNYEQARLVVADLDPVPGTDPAVYLAVIDAMENPALKEKAIELIQQSPLMFDGSNDRAPFFALLGEYELAMDSLEKGFAEGDSYAIHIKRTSLFDPLRDNPRFQALLAKMNL